MNPPTDPPLSVTPLFLAERARLGELLAALEPADFQRPSPCPGWTVLGLCAHLVGDDLAFLARHRDGYYGTPGPANATESEFIAWLDGTQEEWVRAGRRLSPRIVRDLLAWTAPQVAAALEAEDRGRAPSRSRSGSTSCASYPSTGSTDSNCLKPLAVLVICGLTSRGRCWMGCAGRTRSGSGT
jgi:uncharacterized protein (TIGR03083 family)